MGCVSQGDILNTGGSLICRDASVGFTGIAAGMTTSKIMISRLRLPSFQKAPLFGLSEPRSGLLPGSSDYLVFAL